MLTLLGSRCVPATFHNLTLFGAEIVSLSATLVTNHSASVPTIDRFTQPPVEVQNATFCNITVSYTHPRQNDALVVEAWLPATGWNRRLQAVGGGGFVAGRSVPAYSAMSGAIADGYATVTTDAGLGRAPDPTTWALLSPGNVNLYDLQNLASVSLEDEAIMAKSIIKLYYGQPPAFSYWNGCSQGGRQGLMLAQRYPTAYDGIAAGAPALHWNDLFPSMQWPQQFMAMLGKYPHPCELGAITAEAISACDKLDGVVDGVIGDVDGCLRTFDPFKTVGRAFRCTEENRTLEISLTAAAVVNATWQGIRNAKGARLWPGLNPGTDLTAGAAITNCSSGTCVGVQLAISSQWLSLFVARDPSIDLSRLSHGAFDWLAHQGKQRYGSVIGTDDADLSAFRQAGGKLVTFHGLIDQLVPSKGVEKYYKEVSALLPDLHGFYRHFEVPGMGHCLVAGPSGGPLKLFDQLRAWVENGTAPEQSPVQITDLQGNLQNRIVCPYPQKPVFDKSCRTVAEARCWSCSHRVTAAAP